jgi:hypothetical protein
MKTLWKLILFAAASASAQVAPGVGAGGANAGSVSGAAASGVTTVAGTAGQVLVNGGTTAASGAVTLSLPTAITDVNSVTAATNQTLTLATLDNNKDILATPHGTGGVQFTQNGLKSRWASDGSFVRIYSGLATATAITDNNYILAAGTGDLYIQAPNAGAGQAHFNSPLSIDSGSLTISGGSVTTAAPASSTAAAWKLGNVAVVSPTSPNRTIAVDVGGTTYYLAAKTTNN